MLKALIIDDEEGACNSLSRLIQEHCPDIEVVHMVPDLSSAVKAIHKYKPQLIFLDIELPDQNGFELFDYFEAPDFEIIFTTAYSEYAMRAFDVSAIDYLLKPIQISKLKLATEKAIRLAGKNATRERVNTLRENLQLMQVQQIALPVLGGLIFVKANDILYLQADGSYTYVVTAKSRTLISKRIKEFEDILSEDIRFFRIHRSYIVNTQYIREYVRTEGILHMDNNETITVARERRQAFEEQIRDIRI